jgi:restriction system protein
MAERGTTMWFVRAGENALFLDDFLDNGEVSIGFISEVGRAAIDLPKKELSGRVKATFPTWKDGKLSSVVNQFTRFVGELKKGDGVVTYDPGQRRYILGTIEGEVTWNAKNEQHPFRRAVAWSKSTSRETLSASTRNVTHQRRRDAGLPESCPAVRPASS